MPNVKRIPRLSVPEDILQKVETTLLLPEEVTATRMRYRNLRFNKFSELIQHPELRKDIPPERLQEIEKNIRFVKETEDYDTLFSLLGEKTGADAADLLAEKLLQLNSGVVDDVLAGLCESYSNFFFENSLILLSEVYKREDISDKIVSLLESNKVRDMLDFSSLLMLLGRSKSREVLPVLYSYFVFFRDNYPQEEYYEAPLLAMYDLIRPEA
jgi:hypothetical protein